MVQWLKRILIVTLGVSLAACGGGGGGGGGSGSLATGSASGASGTTVAPATCSLLDRQNWAAAQLREWYLFPDTLPASLDPSGYATVDAYVDALTATARAQGKDRYFTYLTSLASENAYYNSGTSTGFGIRLATDATAKRVTITEAFENAPALDAGVDRGAEILAIGQTAASLRTVGDIIAAEGVNGITAALGANTAGLTRVLRVSDGAGTRDITLTKADYALLPVSTRYGTRIISDGGRQVGYVNLRTFISTAEAPLRQAFDQFRAAGITDVIVDLRYNGGGLLSTAELLADLLGGNRAATDVIDRVTYRPEKAAKDTTATFAPQSQSIAPLHIAFIGTGGTASASELVINAFVPYLHVNAALVGTNTFGKPVGQIALDRSACDDRLRVIAFAIQNAAGNGGYYTGLAGSVEASCQAGDDVSRPLGDAAEASTRAALDFVEGKPCNRISADAVTTLAATSRRLLLTPDHPNTAQREVPGLF
jgi:carboxyl-terminal processing protease